MYTYHIFRVLWSSWEEDFSSPHFSGWSFCLLFQNKSHNKKIYYCYYLGLEFFSLFLSFFLSLHCETKTWFSAGSSTCQKMNLESKDQKNPCYDLRGSVWHGGHTSRLILAQNVSVGYQLPLSLPMVCAMPQGLRRCPVMHQGIPQTPLSTVQLWPWCLGMVLQVPRAPLGELLLSVCK